METEAVETWVRGYVRAWESNDPEAIGRLFTEDGRYYTAPHREPWRGRDGIIAGWFERKDAPAEWTFRYEVLGVSGDLGFVRGWTHYVEPPTDFGNLWMIRLTPEGRCAEFTEWWMQVEGA